MAEFINDIVLIHVWIHSHGVSGRVDSISVFDISGTVNMTWYTEALEPESYEDKVDLAERFYKFFQRTEDSAWFLCRMKSEPSPFVIGKVDHYCDVLGFIDRLLEK